MTARIPDLNGWYTVQRNPISRVGVFAYTARSVGAPGWENDPNRMVMVYRPAEELADPEAIESFKLVPWIDDHTMLGDPALQPGLTPPEDAQIQGVVGEQIEYDPTDRTLYANLKVWGKRLAALIDAGKKQLSLGYRCVYEFTEGYFEGQKFEAIQRRLRGNHNASVMHGRMGPGVDVLDHFEFAFDARDFAPMKKTLRARVLAKLGTNATDEQIRVALDAALDAEGDGEGDGEMTLAQAVGVLKQIAPQITEMQATLAKLSAPAAAVIEDNLPADMEPVIDAAGKPCMDAATGTALFRRKKSAPAKVAAMAADTAVLARLKTAEDTIAEFKAKPIPTPKTLMAEIAVRDALADKLSGFVGAFDHATMTLAEVSKYGVEKLGLKDVADGAEFAAVRAYLHDRKAPHQLDAFALDTAPAAGGKSVTDAYFGTSQAA